MIPGMPTSEDPHEPRNGAPPLTWSDYFTKLRSAQEAEREAGAEFHKSGERLKACTEAVAALDDWARAAHKVQPYTGGHMKNEEVTL